MTLEQQRIAIAKACGWGDDEAWIAEVIKRHEDECTRAYYQDRPKPTGGVPDYLNDLNAMHEAEKFLNHDQDLDYSESLEVVVQGKFNCNNGEDMRRLRSATASQRAEAFLRTLNLWTE